MKAFTATLAPVNSGPAAPVPALCCYTAPSFSLAWAMADREAQGWTFLTGVAWHVAELTEVAQ